MQEPLLLPLLSNTVMLLLILTEECPEWVCGPNPPAPHTGPRRFDAIILYFGNKNMTDW